jgi:hypothetical protein
MAGPQLRASRRELCDVLAAVSSLDERCRRVLRQFLDRVELNERQARELQEELADSLKPCAEQVERLAEVPGGIGASSGATRRNITKRSGPWRTTSAE